MDALRGQDGERAYNTAFVGRVLMQDFPALLAVFDDVHSGLQELVTNRSLSIRAETVRRRLLAAFAPPDDVQAALRAHEIELVLPHISGTRTFGPGSIYGQAVVEAEVVHTTSRSSSS